MTKTWDVWYMKPHYFREGIMGMKWLRKSNIVPKLDNLSASHTKVRSVEAEDAEQVFVEMQGENWSPNGEAVPLIESLGLSHTSMSVGDIAVSPTGQAYFVDRVGFIELGRMA